MRNMQTVTIPERTEERCVSLTCDLCGAVSPRPGEWGIGSHEINEVRIEHRESSDHPDYLPGTLVSFHLCPACWTGRLVPWLESQGAKPTVDEVDW